MADTSPSRSPASFTIIARLAFDPGRLRIWGWTIPKALAQTSGLKKPQQHYRYLFRDAGPSSAQEGEPRV